MRLNKFDDLFWRFLEREYSFGALKVSNSKLKPDLLTQGLELLSGSFGTQSRAYSMLRMRNSAE